MLGAELFPADLAERYGWVNRALPDAELDGFVDALARRIAALPAKAAKAAIDAAEASGSVPYPGEEAAAHGRVHPSPDVVVERMRLVLAAGAQTPDGERDLEGLLDSIAYPAA